MTVSSKKEALLLFLGDVAIFLISLWLMLLLRYREVPSKFIFNVHLAPFAILFAVWILVFFIAGLYEKHTIILKSKLSSVILRAQIINSIIAVVFFYLIPYFGITPKTNLFIYLIVSFFLILYWRIHGHDVLSPGRRQNAILIGSGDEVKELLMEVNNNNRYELFFISSVDLDEVDSLDFQEDILNRVYSEDIFVIAVDLRNEKVEPMLPHLYNLIFSKIRFVDMHKIYEDIFDRVPLSLVRYNWFLENISTAPKATYDSLKRLMDIIVSLVLGVLSLVIYPFVFLAIKFDDGGPMFFIQERIGKNNNLIQIIKFRSMTIGGMEEDEVTRVGGFLRKTRIDELPQLWNVLRGDLSLIGPRPELPSLGKLYEEEISYYNIRHLIKPGLSGWAQLYHEGHPHHKSDVRETKTKLSYDLYYIKNRSLALDIKIALKTLKTLMSRAGV